MTAEDAATAQNRPALPVVPTGYRQTDVGIIPENWQLSTLGSLTSLLTNGFVGTATSAYVDSDDGILYIQGYNVEPNSFNFKGIKRVSKYFHARNAKSCLRAGDLLTIQTGDIGVTAIVTPDLAGANCHALIISRFYKHTSDPRYYSQYFNSSHGRAAFKSIETGTTMKHLNGGDMKRLLLPCPPLMEQKAIAEALCDADELIRTLENLIAKKRILKQGAMQDLFSGRLRLSGFHENWKEIRLATLGQTYGGLSAKTKSDFDVGTARFIKFTSVMLGVKINPFDLGKVYVAPSENQNRVQKGDIFFNGSSETPEEVGMCALLDEEVENLYLNSFCFGFRLSDLKSANGLFLAYFFRSPQGRALLVPLAQGSTRYNLSKRALLTATFLCPDVKEQAAIAAILSDMDDEITALESNLTKARQVKQGMMQELLTGRIRLI